MANLVEEIRSSYFDFSNPARGIDKSLLGQMLGVNIKATQLNHTSGQAVDHSDAMFRLDIECRPGAGAEHHRCLGTLHRPSVYGNCFPPVPDRPWRTC